MDQKEDPTICYLHKDTYRLKVKGWRKIYHANNTNQKKAGIAILVSHSKLQSEETYQG